MNIPGNLMRMYVAGLYKLGVRRHTACTLGGAIPGRSEPPCIRCRNKEYLLFNATLALRSFTPDFGDSTLPELYHLPKRWSV